MRVTILGCGTSTGVPMIGCTCPVCTSSDPKDKRLRSSIVIETQGRSLLVDTTPDLREQCLRFGVERVDAVLFTHAHADHLHGIDDVRQLNIRVGKAIDLYAAKETLWHLETRFGYALHGSEDTANQRAWWRPALTPHLFEGPFEAAGVPIVPVKQRHGRTTSWGFRVGTMLYSSDVDGFPEESEPALEGLDLWIVDALRAKPHSSHSHLERTLGWIDRFRPKHAVLTHMNHEVSYAAWARELPAGVEPAYDGLVLEVPEPSAGNSSPTEVARVA